ncbi:DUF2283 domain-containing protein [Rhodoplanes sp. SY1]|uniref:DUF2283 domain-containing protein n=1 Tax=Rhodoplanes sp. SY1 TaxID=3166646 RepID=UPI0038B620D9
MSLDSGFAASPRPGMTESGSNGKQYYKRDVRQDREARAMTDMTYDPEADAVYLRLGRGEIVAQEEHGPLICDLDAERRIVGIEILSAEKVLAPGDWQNARRPGRADAAE